MKKYFLTGQKFKSFISRLAEGHEVFIPVLEHEKAHFQRFYPEDDVDFALGHIRAVEPVKHFFFKSKEPVATFGKKVKKEIKPTVIVGVKRCDLRALEVYDKVFLEGEFVDPFYKERRGKTLFISADCPTPEATCFCTLVGTEPFVTAGSDLNLTALKTGYLCEVISNKGKKIVETNSDLFKETSPEELKQRETSRKKAGEKLKEINSKAFKTDTTELVAEKDIKFWLQEAASCVECCGCLMICPTCYCFLLYDEPVAQNSSRMRIWDACYYAAYARVGGGANPRAKFGNRFKNRFDCKFNYFQGYHDFYACSGCGRCISGCTAKIDIREVLWRL